MQSPSLTLPGLFSSPYIDSNSFDPEVVQGSYVDHSRDKKYFYYAIKTPPAKIERVIKLVKALFSTVVTLGLCLFSAEYRSLWREVIWNRREVTAGDTLALKEKGLTELPGALNRLNHFESIEACQNHLRVLPSFEHMKRLKSVDVSYNRIKSLGNLKNLASLEALHLKGNPLGTFSGEGFTRLKVLSLFHTFLTSISNVGDMVNLEKLDLSENLFPKIPDEFHKLTKLRELKITGELEAFPSSISTLSELEVLRFSSYKVTSLPKLEGLHKLKSFELARCRLRVLNVDFSEMKCLEIVDLNYNQLETLPQSIGSLNQLTYFDISQNSIRELPWKGIKPHLKGLKIGSNQIKELPKDLAGSKKITYMDVSCNPLGELPGWISEFADMDILDINSCGLSHVPSLKKMTQLTVLSMEYNNLTNFPEGLFELKQLRQLNVSHNRLTEVPEAIGNLTELKYLSLSFCRHLAHLPDSLSRCQKLECLYLDFCDFTEIPDCIFQLPRGCKVSLEGNYFTEEAIERARVRVRERGYAGPNKITFSMHHLTRDLLEDSITTALHETFEDVWKRWSDEEPPRDLEEAQKKSLKLFLRKAEGSKDYTLEVSKQRLKNSIKGILSWLPKASPDEKALAFCSIDNSSDACSDDTSRGVNELNLLKKYSESPHLTMEGLKKLVIGAKRLELLQDIAKEKCNELQLVDDVAVYLHYEVDLREVLDLPLIVEDMLFRRISGLTRSDIESARIKILEATISKEQQIEILCQNRLWQLRLENESDFSSISRRCSLDKEAFCDKSTGKESETMDAFYRNLKTVWNPYYLMTKGWFNKRDDSKSKN